MRNTRIIRYWSQDTRLVSYFIANIEKGKKWIKIITNVVLPGGWEIAVCWKRYNINSIETKIRDIKLEKKCGPIP